MKIIYLIFGFIFLGLGIVGIYMPLLPATPFLLLATYFFGRGSKKFNAYFISTKLYKENIEPIKNKIGMTKKRKIKILGMISFFIALSFILINNLHARICLAIVLIFHYFYFFFKVKTISEDKDV
ncbi:YbaN family protein [Peptoniphilus sp. MSJ-1]|uniref:YbaN family protein n=1 Tax=Peptoniphilus ovalis TaxID=2841503 RepID=A0ABS6FJS2_9FIRM|nr:YbaN family protein [Peptoniphilus ovalis]MBU5669450.1 YbaN family protein [Peptoniphilus ovalis]